MIERGADVNVKVEGGETLLSRAANGGVLEHVNILLKAKAEVNTEPVRTALSRTPVLIVPQNPLLAAVNGRHTECVRSLLEAKANDLSAALALAASHGYMESVDALLNARASPDARTVRGHVRDDTMHCNGSTKLFSGCYHGCNQGRARRGGDSTRSRKRGPRSDNREPKERQPV